MCFRYLPLQWCRKTLIDFIDSVLAFKDLSLARAHPLWCWTVRLRVLTDDMMFLVNTSIIVWVNIWCILIYPTQISTHITWHVIIDVWQGFHTSFIGVPYLEVPPDINRWIFRCFQRLGCTNSADKADCLVVWCISVLACLENDVVWDAVKTTPVPELQVCRRPLSSGWRVRGPHSTYFMWIYAQIRQPY